MSDIVKNLDRHELAMQTSAEASYAYETVDEIIGVFFKKLAEGVALKGYAEVHGLGSFKLKELAPREGHLPNNEPFSVGKRITVEFNPFQPFRESVEAVTGVECIL